MQVLIAGGGIGGLAAGLALARRGRAVTIFEQAPAFGEVGAGVQISPNGLHVLDALGVGAQVRACGVAPPVLELRDGLTGTRIFRIPIARIAEARFGAPYLHLHRADLANVLRAALAAIAPGALQLGAQVTGVVQSPNAVEVTLADGRIITGDVLIGADGLRSAVRRAVLPGADPRDTGLMAWRALVPAEAVGPGLVPEGAIVWAAPGRHAVTYRLRGGRLINFVGVVPSTAPLAEAWDTRGDAHRLQDDFAGFAPPVAALTAAVTQCHRWGLYDRDALSQWAHGRIALLGDAAHPLPPYLAQGAVMALEDAAVLSAALDCRPGDIHGALAAYSAARAERAARVLDRSRANARLFHTAGGVRRLAAFGPMWLADRLVPPVIHHAQDWLYGYRVPEVV